MKPTTQKRIEDALTAIICHVGGTHPDILPILRDVLERILREQDHDTRHACAEACAALSKDILKRTHSPIAALQCAHQACMNTYSI